MSTESTDARELQSGETAADLILQIDHVSVTEKVNGESTVTVADASLLVLSLLPTDEDLSQVNAALGLPPNTIASDANATGKPLVFVMVGPYKIPLGAAVPVLQMSRTHYSFIVAGMFIEVELPANTPEEDLENVPFVLQTYGILRVHPSCAAPSSASTSRAGDASASAVAVVEPTPQPRTGLASRVAKGVGFVGKVAATGLQKGSQLLAVKIGQGASLIVSKTNPRRRPLNVSQETHKRIERTRAITKGAVILTGTATSSIIAAAAVLGNAVGGHVAAKLPEGHHAAVAEIGSAVITSGAMVFAAVDSARKTIVTSSCENITKVVTHRYGDEAGKASKGIGGIASNVIDIASAGDKMGKKAFLKAAGKEAAKTIGDQYGDGSQKEQTE